MVAIDKLINSKPESDLSIVRRAYYRNAERGNKLVQGGKEGGPTSSYLAERERNGKIHIHRGIDIAAKEGSEVYSANNGVVFLLSPDGAMRGYGNTIVIKHDDGTGGLYGHLHGYEPSLRVGDTVSQGQLIGYVGKTESGSFHGKMKPHLHFEIHKRATRNIHPDTPERLDPIKYLSSVGMTI
jgi:murein DD-endopeptidase MepM/ murein hydrolase activator NlpD